MVPEMFWCICGQLPPMFFILHLNLFLLLSALGFCCCEWAFSNYGEWGLLFSCGTQASVTARGVSCSESCEIFVPGPGIKLLSPAISGQILNQWTIREVSYFILKFNFDIVSKDSCLQGALVDLKH